MIGAIVGLVFTVIVIIAILQFGILVFSMLVFGVLLSVGTWWSYLLAGLMAVIAIAIGMNND